MTTPRERTDAFLDAVRDGTVETPEMRMGDLLVWGKPVRGRVCGSCTACCIQVPVDLPEGHKDANERCRHLCSKGCRIYARRPTPCVAWSCRWLFDPEAGELRRPDQAGYVVDCTPDTVLLSEDGQTQRPVNVVQVWVDPKRPDAHRDPALRRYLAVIAERHGMLAIVRWSAGDGMVLIPPACNTTGEWVEFRGGESQSHEQHQAALAAVGVASRFVPAGRPA